MKRHHWCAAGALLLAFLCLDCASHGRLKPPKVVSDIPLDYPLTAQLKRIEGEVGLTVFVNPQGKPEQVDLTSSSGYTVLDEAALNFVKKLDFTPGTLDEYPVSAWTRLILRYRLTEQAFEQNRWLAEVHHLQKEIAQTPDSLTRENALKRLYTNYFGCMTYVESSRNPAINAAIRTVISRETERYWSPFWNEYAAPFVLFDDFLSRYPESSLLDQARQDLIRYLMEMETRIRMDALRSRRLSRSAAGYIELIEKRLTSLQKEVMPLEE